MFPKKLSLFSLVLLLVRAGAFGAGADDGAMQAYICEDIRKPFFKADLGGIYRPARDRSQAQAFSMPKPAGATRVFVAGESAAMMLGGGEWLEASGGLEAINCGMSAYESYRIAGVLEELLAYQPDMMVLLSGNNEGMNEVCGGASAEFRRRRYRLLERAYSLKPDRLPARTRATLKVHEDRVREMAAAARKKRIPLVICGLPANLLLPPEDEILYEVPAFVRALAAYEKKDYKAALAGFLSATGGARTGPFARYYAGLSLRALGDDKQAAELLREVLDLSWSQDRTGPARNAMLRRVAEEEGACFADLEKVFRELSPGGIPGFDQFVDGVHWRSSYRRAVWDAIFSAAGACGLRAAGAYRGMKRERAAGPEPEAHAQMLSYAVSWLSGTKLNERSVAEFAYLLKAAPGVMEKALSSPRKLKDLIVKSNWSGGLAERIDALYPGFLINAAEACRRAGNSKRALELAERALAGAPGDPNLLLVKERILFPAAPQRPAGPETAACAAADLSPEDWQRTKKFSDEGRDFMLKGDLVSAEKSFLAAAAAYPCNAGALISLCAVKKQAGNYEAALEYCGRATKRPPGEEPDLQRRTIAAEAYLEMGQIGLAMRRPAAAAEYFREAVGAAPAGWGGKAKAEAYLKELGH